MALQQSSAFVKAFGTHLYLLTIKQSFAILKKIMKSNRIQKCVIKIPNWREEPEARVGAFHAA